MVLVVNSLYLVLVGFSSRRKVGRIFCTIVFVDEMNPHVQMIRNWMLFNFDVLKLTDKLSQKPDKEGKKDVKAFMRRWLCSD